MENFHALYRTVEVDDDGDLYDWGVVVGEDESDAILRLRERFDGIGLRGDQRKVEFHVVINPGLLGVAETQAKRIVTV